MQQSVVQDEVTVPWDLLDTAALRSELLVKPETFSHVKTLDPMRMAPREVYDVLDLLLKGQTSGLRPLEFSIRDNSNSNAIQDDGSDISEKPDPPTPPSLPNLRTQGDIDNPLPPATAINQTPSQQSVMVKPNSKSKKRTETEESGKGMTKRTKIAVPAREQSSRYEV
jgi:hypothetical protein